MSLFAKSSKILQLFLKSLIEFIGELCENDSIMSSYSRNMLGGTIAVSVLFLAVCSGVCLLFPAEETLSDFESYTALLGSDYSEEVARETGLKADYSDFMNESDRGLELYRQPQSRPSIEWFYTQVTGNREVALAILENADKNNIPLSLAFSLAYVESHYKPSAVNRNSNATIDRGLFQLNSASFPKLSETDFFDPNVSAKYGMIHLRWCMDLAGKGNEVTALAMYNAGTARVRANKTPQHTLNYVAKISSYRARLESKFNTDIVAFYNVPSRTSGLVRR